MNYPKGGEMALKTPSIYAAENWDEWLSKYIAESLIFLLREGRNTGSFMVDCPFLYIQVFPPLFGYRCPFDS